MLPDELKINVESALSMKYRHKVQISEALVTGGGCINETYTLKTNENRFFIKFNSAAAFPGMFETEAVDLKILAQTRTIDTPEVICTGSTVDYAFLLLEFIESGAPELNFWEEFGRNLAGLHRHSAKSFGLDHDNFIGSLVQTNTEHPDFISFFISQRIEPQLKNARDKGAFSLADLRYFESLFHSLQNILPVEKPALIHGDLWSGNYVVTSFGSPCLVDPAISFGHRESDIAMTQLFGGFHPGFYHAYTHAWPMEKDWQKRMDIYNLYPLLVHVNLFGGGYAGQVLRIIRQF